MDSGEYFDACVEQLQKELDDFNVSIQRRHRTVGDANMAYHKDRHRLHKIVKTFSEVMHHEVFG